MPNFIIETFDLTKSYKLKGQNKNIVALDKVNLSIEDGEIFGLLGPNGAGKTTLISILTTLIQPTSGYAIINGYNILKKPNQAKSSLALMLDNKMLYGRLNAYRNLKFFCKIYKVPNYKEKIYSMVEEFGLENWLNQYVGNFSSGMRMKLALCRTLLLNRKILLLDEPTLGLDVKSITSTVKILKESNKTILITSHDMGVIEKLCNRVAFINKGKILKIGDKSDIKNLEHQEIKIEIEITENMDKLKSDLNQQNFISEVSKNKKALLISLINRRYYNDLLLILRNYTVIKIKELDLSLEDLFLKFC